MRQLFISYARENKPDVEALVRDLDVDVLEMNRVAEILGGAVELPVHTQPIRCKAQSLLPSGSRR